MALIEMKQVNKLYQSGHQTLEALKPTDFELDAGEFKAIIGPSGSGKTTMLTIIGQLQKPSAGEILINGKDTHNLSEHQLSQVRFNEFGFILQASNLIPFLNVRDQFRLVDKLTKKKKLQYTPEELLKMLDIEALANNYPNELSGGERQRAAIARALYNDPQIILADEPTASLDTSRAVKLVQLLQRIAHELHRGVIMVTHDTRLLKYVDTVYEMRDGILRPVDKRKIVPM